MNLFLKTIRLYIYVRLNNMLKFCSLSSSSAGNSYFISSGNTSILVDAGISASKIKKSLVAIGERIDDIDAIFVTHEHSDHMKGLKVLLKKNPIDLYMTEGTFEGGENLLLPDYERVRCFSAGDSVRVGDLLVDSYSVSHDANEPVCYRISCGETAVGVITDLGWIDPEYVTAFKAVDLLHLESNYDEDILKIGPYPPFLKKRILSEHGHLSNLDAANIGAKVLEGGRLQHLVLGHLSKTNNHPDLAYETVRTQIALAGYEVGEHYELTVSFREQVGKVFIIRGNDSCEE